MNVEEVLNILDGLLKPKRLSDTQKRVFYLVWDGKNYEEIARHLSYDTSYVKHVGSRLWRLLSEAFGEKITKTNFRSVLGRRLP